MQNDSTSFGKFPATICESTTEAVDACATDLVAVINSTLHDHRQCRIIMCGGNAARLVITRLASIHHNFEGVEFYLADERCVEPGDPNRNDQLLIDLLVSTDMIRRDAVHSIPGEHGPQRGAMEYASMIRDIPQFDVAFLSMGEDGHVASIFPNHSSMNVQQQVIPIIDAPKIPAARISMSISALRTARHRLVAAFGGEKSAAIARIHGGWDPPAVQVEPTRWYLDRAAIRDIRG